MDSYRPVEDMQGMVHQVYLDSNHKSGDLNDRVNKKLAEIQDAGGHIDDIRYQTSISGGEMKVGLIVFYRILPNQS